MIKVRMLNGFNADEPDTYIGVEAGLSCPVQVTPVRDGSEERGWTADEEGVTALVDALLKTLAQWSTEHA